MTFVRIAWKRRDPSDQIGKSVFVTQLGNLNSINQLTRRKGKNGQQSNEEEMHQAGKQNKRDYVDTKAFNSWTTAMHRGRFFMRDRLGK